MSDVPDQMADEITRKQSAAWERMHSAESGPMSDGIRDASGNALELTCAIRNALPALLDCAEALIELREEVRDLQMYPGLDDLGMAVDKADAALARLGKEKK